MRKIISIIIIIVGISLMLISGVHVFEGFVSIQNSNLTTEQIDAVYDKTPFVVNTLPMEERVIMYDNDHATIRLFTGMAGVNTVNMCTVSMPRVMGSQAISLQLVVNGAQQFVAPLKLSYQVYNYPKFIKGVIVIRTYIGMYDLSKQHFYIVIETNGAGYDTEIAQIK
jgi:hypothetical protein